VIGRIWHGWTAPANADAYESLLRTTILPGITRIVGYEGAHLLRHDRAEEVEFVTITWFASEEAVRAFAGPDDARAVVPDAARALLTRFDERSAHYALVLSPGDSRGPPTGAASR
jgi:heme-degrading monooxygenase HmoA